MGWTGRGGVAVARTGGSGEAGNWGWGEGWEGRGGGGEGEEGGKGAGPWGAGNATGLPSAPSVPTTARERRRTDGNSGCRRRRAPTHLPRAPPTLHCKCPLPAPTLCRHALGAAFATLLLANTPTRATSPIVASSGRCIDRSAGKPPVPLRAPQPRASAAVRMRRELSPSSHTHTHRCVRGGVRALLAAQKLRVLGRGAGAKQHHLSLTSMASELESDRRSRRSNSGTFPRGIYATQGGPLQCSVVSFRMRPGSCEGSACDVVVVPKLCLFLLSCC